MAELVAIKAPNRRGAGDSSVYCTSDESWTQGLVSRVFVKRQSYYYCRPLWSWGRSTLMAKRELRALLAFKGAGVSVPVVVSYQENDNQATLVTGEIPDALSLDEALEVYPEHEQSILSAAATTIRQMHRAGWTHGALYPCHLLVRMKPFCQVYLVDLEKAKKSRRTSRDLKRLIRYLSLPPLSLMTFLKAYRRA